MAKSFVIFRQGEEELCCQLGQVERTAERWCRDTRQEIQVLSERQEIFESTVEDKLKLQSRANERYHD